MTEHHNTNGTGDSGPTARNGAVTPSTAELLETAVLDAVGLLDEADAAAFDAAFRAAPAEVRQSIIEEQARLSVSEAFLADVDAPAELRERVLAAVHDAIAARRGQTAISATEATPATAPAASPTAAAVQHPGGRRVPKMAKARRVHAVWRATSIGLGVAVVALAAVQFQLQGDYRAFRTEASVARLIEAIGVAHIRDTLLDPATHRAAFTPENTDMGQAAAAVWMNSDWSAARLYASQLPEARTATYRIVELDDAGKEMRTLQTFESVGLLDTVSVPVDRDARVIRLAIVMDHDGVSTRLMTTTLRMA